ncbi:MAG: aminotransferase class III-fold pyridoxal phosphate-dependent enzyme [Lentisphaeria bacterium]|nr:aminotransferase class III-fold pyridoxal phosphate-dependent enzyme [Lentisphaeria bacterium]
MTGFHDVRRSLADVVGAEAVGCACEARAWLTGEDVGALRTLAEEPISFYPAEFVARQEALLHRVGSVVCRPLGQSPAGASSRSFAAASHVGPAPVSGHGWYRVGEDGRLYFASKSEHYHAALGHGFPGYDLIRRARALGIPNATHNNTRGLVTRRAERELVRLANGIPADDGAALDRCIAAADPACPNRVLNLQSGSLAAEAAIKLALARFFPQDGSGTQPPLAGYTPVFVVIGDDDGTPAGNYHGTTLTAQMMRGLWPGWLQAQEDAGILAVRAVRPNRIEDLDRTFAACSQGRFRAAAFLHEIILMNYGARRLTTEFLHHAYALCRRHDVLTVVDEIQSCVWGEGLFSYREWGLTPDIVVVGKGFPGGEYAASRVLFPARLDILPQFGALVTNGQEELSSLAYLVTSAWTEANQEEIRRVGRVYETALGELVDLFPNALSGVEGCRHLGALCFRDLALARGFVEALTAEGFDVSVQIYKASCPPVALTKLPVTVTETAVRFVVGRMRRALESLRDP